MIELTNSIQRRLADPATRVACLTAALCAVGLVLLGVGPRARLGGDVALPWWSLAIGFALAEVLVVHIELRNQAHTLTLVEIPLVLALFFASPTSLIVGRLLGAGAVLVLKDHQGPRKLAFNLSLFLADSAVAVAVFGLLSGERHLHHPASWLAAVAAVATANLLGAVSVAEVIHWHGGQQRLAQLAATSALTTLTNASLAINAALLVSISWAAVAVLAVIVSLSYVAYRGYLALRQRYANMTSLFAFTRLIDDAEDPQAVLDAMLVHTCGMLRAERAEITLFADVDEATFRSTDPDAATAPWATAAELPAALRCAEGDERPTLVAGRGTRDADLVALLAHLGAPDAMVTTLRLGEHLIGVLVVAQRTSEVSTFDAEDGRTFATLADHASIAIENSRLLERLTDEEARRAHEARHDALTGLPNRAHFAEQLQDRVGRAAQEDRAGLLLTADLVGFSEINETLGHPAGDLVLSGLAARLRRRLGPGALLSRTGADVFAWYVELDSAGEAAAAIDAAAELVQEWLAEPVVLEGIPLRLGAAVGAAIAPEHGPGAATLLQRADVALSTAKASGLRRPVVYDLARDDNSLRRLALAASLREAIDGQQIAVVYQPKTRLRDGEVVGVEALARWHHPHQGTVSPDEFIHLAERTGLIVDLTLDVLRQALRDQRRWRAAGHDLSVAVNVSTRALLDADLPAKIAAVLRAEGGDARTLTLEVTESVMMADPESMIASLERLSGSGITISIDDFGTGYSSLAYLQRLPAREVKIDKSFVLPITRSTDAAAIVASIIGLAHSLGLSVVAEGIEDHGAWEALARLGCDVAQGYYVSRPIPTDALETWLDRLHEAEAPPGGAATPPLRHHAA